MRRKADRRMNNRAKVVRLYDESEQDTMPLPSIKLVPIHLPTVREIRERCRMSYFEVAMAAGVNPRVVYWMEQGIAVSSQEARKILHVFSHLTGSLYTFENVQGIRIKESGE